MQEPINNTDEISLKELIQKAGEWFAFFKSKWKTIVLAGIILSLIHI